LLFVSRFWVSAVVLTPGVAGRSVQENMATSPKRKNKMIVIKPGTGDNLALNMRVTLGALIFQITGQQVMDISES